MDKVKVILDVVMIGVVLIQAYIIYRQQVFIHNIFEKVKKHLLREELRNIKR